MENGKSPSFGSCLICLVLAIAGIITAKSIVSSMGFTTTSTLAILVVAFVVLGLVNVLLDDSKKVKNEPQKAPLAQTDFKVNIIINDGDFYCSIAGAKYHCTTDDIGGFLGYVIPEPTNEYDKNACAVYRNDGKHIGYIPKSELEEYAVYSGGKRCPCVGFIKSGDEIPLFGKVKVFNCDEDTTQIGVVKFVRWMIANFGKLYIPAGFNVNSNNPPKTKKEWLEALDNYISENEE